VLGSGGLVPVLYPKSALRVCGCADKYLRMTAFDPPPHDFAKLILVTTEVAPASLVRLASAKHLSSDPFRRSYQFRFDAPDGSFGVLYAAFDLETAFVETLVRAKGRPCRRVIL
jgi:hypothetical protein